MKKLIKNNVYWVGKTDWELKYFHGFELSTHKGSSYNSYLVKEDKVALIDTVWKPFAEEFVENLKKEIDLKKIDYIIANHGETDHSGSLPLLLEHIPDTPIYCTANAVKSLKGHYHKDWNFKVVKTGDKINLGSKELVFVEMTMLHWPDSMACYLTGDNILFSNDAFGQHLASENLFNDLVDKSELYNEAIKYYANILTPFSPMLKRKLEEITSLNLTIDYICTSHGILWRDNPAQIIELYSKWCNDYQENQISIIYDSMWDGTRVLAENIALGLKEADSSVNIKLHNTSKSDKNDIITDIFKSKAVLFGSPTVNRGIVNSVAGLLEQTKGLAFKKKKAASFGCYGWSGESVAVLNEGLKKAGFELVDDGLKVLWNPDEASVEKAFEFGKSFVGKI